MNLKGVAVEKDKKANTISICATYEMPEVKGELEIDYLIMPNTGAMKVSQEFDASDDAKVSDLFRFGMLMQLPYDMDKSQYYGRGPIENYSDREDCMRIGIYSDDADNQYFPYIRPQESNQGRYALVESDRCFRLRIQSEELQAVLCFRHPLRHRRTG